MKIEFKYLIKQPVFFVEKSTVKKGYVLRQHFSNEVKDFALPASQDNLKTDKYYQIQLHDRSFESKAFREDELYRSREEFFERMNESWNSL
ncbi:hypothetical protein [Winogradskyella forsetii]|uniref:hypothetical protein n=1 Tax=Winogradskyella forsetii TaxID=2686077 RepID=UPI0015BA2846|nr:hypothetical protein [Winogradskyella forsetii]